VSESTDAVFRALSDPTRREMLALLRDRELTVMELAEPFQMSQPAVSQHLAVLRDSGLVSARRDGRNRLYRIEPENLRVVDDWLEHYRHFWTDKLWALGELLDETSSPKPKKGRTR
jgi:DNA-binding transcriptional ArsR family regulator